MTLSFRLYRTKAIHRLLLEFLLFECLDFVLLFLFGLGELGGLLIAKREGFLALFDFDRLGLGLGPLGESGDQPGCQSQHLIMIMNFNINN